MSIEIKRPSHHLTVADLNQAERYLVLAEQYSTGMSWKAMLIGQVATEDARRTVKYRTALVIRTFTDLVADARARYNEYLKTVKLRK